MASNLSQPPREPKPATVLASSALVAAIAIGYAFERTVIGALPLKYLPWELGRIFGIATLIILWVLTNLGFLARARVPLYRAGLSQLTLLRLHRILAAVGGSFLVVHLFTLAIDSYAGVGFVGIFVPFSATYRPLAVAIGTAALYLGLTVGGSAALSGLLVGPRWLSIHRLAIVMFLAAWIHGVTAGTDTPALLPLYIAILAETVVTALLTSRRREVQRA